MAALIYMLKTIPFIMYVSLSVGRHFMERWSQVFWILQYLNNGTAHNIHIHVNDT